MTTAHKLLINQVNVSTQKYKRIVRTSANAKLISQNSFFFIPFIDKEAFLVIKIKEKACKYCEFLYILNINSWLLVRQKVSA